MLVTGDRRLVHGAGVVSRAGNESSQRLKFHNHGEGSATGFTFKTLLRNNALVEAFSVIVKL